LLLALLLAAVLLVLSTLVLAGIREDQRNRLERNLAQQADIASLLVYQEYLRSERSSPADFMEQRGQRIAVELGMQSGLAVTLYRADGKLAGTSLPIAPTADVSDALAHVDRGQSAYITAGDRLLYLAPLNGIEERLGAVQFHYSLAEQHAFYNRIRNLFLAAGAAVLAVSFFLGYFYVHRQVSAIHRLNRAAGRIEQGDYLDSPPLSRRDELGDLANGIYEMSRGIEAAVTALTDEQRKLLTAIDRLQELERQQKQFIGNISHELKTPLTSIRAYADLLAMYRDDPGLLEEARAQIRQEADRLYELVEKALRLSASNVYEFESRAAAVPIVPLLETTVQRLQGKAAAHEVSLSSKHLSEGTVWCDPELLEHIMLNLLDNAIKYNRRGGSVTVANRLRLDEGIMEIEVRDTGIGITFEARERIFDPFYTVNDDRSRAHGGTGLGLTLVRALAEKQHGSIRLAESGSNGSTFVVTMPLSHSTSEVELPSSST
jgi:two-component system, OmpR family, phosphate regulon sensor histidine kinase PhoR